MLAPRPLGSHLSRFPNGCHPGFAAGEDPDDARGLAETTRRHLHALRVRMLDSYPHADALAEAAATAITARLSEALRERGHASLVGTGGRSPGPVYDRLRV